MKLSPLPPMLGKDLMTSILSKRDGRLEGFVYKLLDNNFGIDTLFPETVDIDENEMSVVIPFADGKRRDGVGDLLEVGGIKTERHQVNPIFLFDHGKHVQLPIGLTEDPKTKAYTVEIDQANQQARAKAFFYQGNGSWSGVDQQQSSAHALFCEQLFDLISKRYIRAGSIGYQVIQAKQLMPDYEKGIPAGLHLLATRMLECSAVVLPANGDTVRKALCLPRVCGQPLSPMLIKSLSPYVGEIKAQIGYEGKKIPPVRWEPGVGAIKTMKKSKEQLPKTEKDMESEETKAAYSEGRRTITPTKLGIVNETGSQIINRRHRSSMAIPEKPTKVIRRSNEPNEKYPHKEKALPDEEANEQPEEEIQDEQQPELEQEQDQEQEQTEEPLGAQILRCIHEDHLILLEEYDSMMATLENEAVKEHLNQLLEGVESILDATEAAFAHEYAELEGLEGAAEPQEPQEEGQEEEERAPEEEKGEAEQDSEDEDTVEASSDDRGEEPTPEEAYEGSQKQRKGKALTRLPEGGKEEEVRRSWRASGKEPIGRGFLGPDIPVTAGPIRNREIQRRRDEKIGEGRTNENSEWIAAKPQKRKSICPDCGNGTVCSKCGTKDFCPTCWVEVKALLTDEQVAKRATQRFNHKPNQQETRTTVSMPGRKYRHGRPGAPEIPRSQGYQGSRPKITLQNPGRWKEEGKDLEPHERILVKEAHRFLGDLSTMETSLFGDDHRHQAYHFGRSLSGIGALEEANGKLNRQLGKEEEKAYPASTGSYTTNERRPHLPQTQFKSGSSSQPRAVAKEDPNYTHDNPYNRSIRGKLPKISQAPQKKDMEEGEKAHVTQFGPESEQTRAATGVYPHYERKPRGHQTELGITSEGGYRRHTGPMATEGVSKHPTSRLAGPRKKDMEVEEKSSSRSLCGAAGSYLSGLANGKNPFGDSFREQAKYWHNALTPHATEPEMEYESKDDEEGEDMGGEVEEKAAEESTHRTGPFARHQSRIAREDVAGRQTTTLKPKEEAPKKPWEAGRRSTKAANEVQTQTPPFARHQVPKRRVREDPYQGRHKTEIKPEPKRKSLKDTFLEQKSQMEELNKQLELISSKVS